MEISNSTLLNILLPNDNKVIKEALKQADLTQLFNTSSNKPTNTQDILKNLFTDVIQGNKSHDTILNLLKNSNVFNDLGNFPKEVQTLLQQLKEVPSLSSLQNKLENFLLNMNSVNEQNIQTQINNSGVFLESKLSQGLGNLPNTVLNILNDLKQLLQNIEHPKTQDILKILDKIISTNSTSNPQELINNSKELLFQLKQFLQSAPSLPNQASVSQTTPLQTLVIALEQILNKETPPPSSLTSLATTVSEAKKSVPSVLNELKQQLQTSLLPKADEMISRIDKLLTPNLSAQEFQTQSKELLSNLKQLLQSLPTPTLTQGQLPTANSTSAIQQLQTLFNTLEPLIHKTVVNNPVFTNPSMAMNLLKEDIGSDMKALLLTVQQELNSNPTSNTQDILKQVDKLLTQIDFNQLMNVASNSNFVYLPFLWDLLEDGTIATKKGSDDIFYCQINLKLKEHGKLDLLLALYNKDNIDITIKAQHADFKNSIHEHLTQLKQSLHKARLVPVGIKLLDLDEEESLLKEELQSFYSTPDLNFGVNIRV